MMISSTYAGGIGDLTGGDGDRVRVDGDAKGGNRRGCESRPRACVLRFSAAAAAGDDAGTGSSPALPRYLAPRLYCTRPITMPTPAAANPRCQLTFCPR